MVSDDGVNPPAIGLFPLWWGIYDDSDGKFVIHLLKLHFLLLHFSPDGGDRFLPSFDLYLYLLLLKVLPDGPDKLPDEAVSSPRSGFQLFIQLLQ